MTKRPIVFMFSGQGSQYHQMGSQLYSSQPVFKYWMDRLDRIVIRELGISVLEELFGARKMKADAFFRTRFTHPAITMVEYAFYQLLIENNVTPDCLLGASLGEFAACAAGGVITPEQMIQLVTGQVLALEKQNNAGGMLAVLGDYTDLRNRFHSLRECELAGQNYPKHFVLSGSRRALRELEVEFKRNDVISVVMPVEYAFHSSLIDAIEAPYLALLGATVFEKPTIPIYSSWRIGPALQQVDPSHLWGAVRQPIFFQHAVQSMESRGPAHYVDLGPGGTLANFVKYNLLGTKSESAFFTSLTPLGNELVNFGKICQSLSKSR